MHQLYNLRIISAYRTVSDDAAGVLAGRVPIDIQLKNVFSMYENLQAKSNSSFIRVQLDNASFWDISILTIAFYYDNGDDWTFYRIGFAIIKNKLVLFVFKVAYNALDYCELTAEAIFRSIKFKKAIEYGDPNFGG